MNVKATEVTVETSPKRIEALTEALAEFGREGPTAVTRIAFTPEDEEAHRFVAEEMRKLGLATRFDAFGNLFGRREGADPTALPVLTGSHLDGPPDGGRFDGTIGVLCALEVLRTMDEAGVGTERPIEVAAIRCEHLDRFGLSCLGSRALSGKLTEADLDQRRDILIDPPDEARTLREVLESCGYLSEPLESVHLAGKLDSYLELHIEQGKVLEERGERLGVITGIAGPTRFHIKLGGSADHSGGTPMDLRRDALAGAAEIVLELERLASAEPPTVGTVGIIEARPGAVHTIVGEAEIWVDIRSVENEPKRRVVERFLSAVEEIATRRGLEMTYECSVDEPPVPCAPRVVFAASDALRAAGLRAIQMPSGGGHDAQHMAHCTEAGMLFVPSVGGISHTPEELTSWEDLAHGADALASCLIRLAGLSSGPVEPGRAD